MAEDNEKVKSALEIALEKAQKLGGMSSDEKQKLKDENLESVGLALSKRYLKGLPVRDVEIELGKYKEDRKTIVTYLLSYLVNEIDMGDPDGAERILEAINHFAGAPAAEKIGSLLNECRSAMKKAWQKNQQTLGAAKRRELARLGISGSAIKPAIEGSPEWLEARQQLHSDYQKRLEGIKSSLQAL
jgi:hypothetical protein